MPFTDEGRVTDDLRIYCAVGLEIFMEEFSDFRIAGNNAVIYGIRINAGTFAHDSATAACTVGCHGHFVFGIRTECRAVCKRLYHHTASGRSSDIHIIDKTSA